MRSIPKIVLSDYLLQMLQCKIDTQHFEWVKVEVSVSIAILNYRNVIYSDTE